MARSFTGPQIALSFAVLLVPPAVVGAGQLAWKAVTAGLPTSFGPEPTAPNAAPTTAAFAIAAPTPKTSLTSAAVKQAGPVSIGARLDRGAVYASGDGLVSVELTITGAAKPGQPSRVPTDLVVVLDRSGSMGGEPLQKARAATSSLIQGLASEDRFALVVYDDSAETAIPLGLASAEHKRSWLRTVERVNERGSTNISDGIDSSLNILNEHVPGRAQRIVLISDGQPNAGDASPEGLAARARQAALHESPLTAVGVGDGFNEVLMRDLADAGTGNFYYVQQTEGLATVFSKEFEAAGATVATGLQIVAHPGSGVRLVSAAGYPIEADGSGALIRIGSLEGGQTRKLWLTYQVTPGSTGPQADLGELGLSFSVDGATLAARLPERLTVGVVQDQAVALASIDKSAWEESVVTERYNLMRQQLADAVRRQDHAGAKAVVQQYKTTTAAENQVLGSAKVEENLRALGYVEASADDSFSGTASEQWSKQNSFSKQQTSDSYFSRREGQMK